jgi:hypothetical protein
MGDSVEIKQGAKPSDRFVASGSSFLADGDTVKVVDAKAAGTQTPVAAAAATAVVQAGAK